MIYAGVQKNVGPAGMVVRSSHLPAVQHPLGRRLDVQHPELLGDLLLRQSLQVPERASAASRKCTKRNLDKAKVMYDFLDSSKMFKGQPSSLSSAPS